jgi:hypothetical protein
MPNAAQWEAECMKPRLTEAELDRLAAEVTAELIAERTCLETLGRCSPEEFELRAIALGGGRLVNIGDADKHALWLLAGQVRAAGLPIPALLRGKLAAKFTSQKFLRSPSSRIPALLRGKLAAKRDAERSHEKDC